MTEYDELSEALDANANDELTQLLDEVEAAIRKYVVVDKDQLALLGPWVLHTYALDAFDYTPYLNIRGGTSSVGKTLLAEILEQLCWEGKLTGSISESVLFRYIETKRPTLFLDELDKALENKANGLAILQILDTGFKRSGGSLRNVPGKKGTWVAKSFSTFCPKAYQTIKQMPGELANRSIPIYMKRKLPSETIARKRDRKIRTEFETIRQQAEAWSRGNTDSLRQFVESDSVAIPEKLSDRAADILEPLFAIADKAGPKRGKRVRDAAVAIVASDEDTRHLNEIILMAVYKVFKPNEEATPREYVTTKVILDYLNDQDEETWSSWNDGKGMSSKELAKRMRAFEAGSKNKRLANGTIVKAYFWDDLKDAFDRFPPPPEKERSPPISPPIHTPLPATGASPATPLKNQQVRPPILPLHVSVDIPRNSLQKRHVAA